MFTTKKNNVKGQQEAQKRLVAKAALDHVPENQVIGVGTGSTTNYFIDALAEIKHKIEGTVASSEATAARLKQHGIPVFELNTVNHLAVYIDGADEANPQLQLIKGGGGALTREKIIANVAKQFICIADQSKHVNVLGRFPLAVEVIPMARSFVAREIIKLGGQPEYREGFTTDNGNIILDIHNLNIQKPIALEEQLNNIVGVVCHGLFATRGADVLLLGEDTKVTVHTHGTHI